MSKLVGWPSPFGYTIFCDDIRFEQGGKRSLIGVYHGELIVFANPPVALPRLALAIQYFERPEESAAPLEILVRASWADEPLIKFTTDAVELRNAPRPIDPGKNQEDVRVGLVWNLNLTPLPLPQAGIIKVRALRGDLEVKLGSLLITFRPPPDEQGNPTNQE